MNEIQNISKLILDITNNSDDYKKCEKYEFEIIVNKNINENFLREANNYAMNKTKEIILLNPELKLINGVQEIKYEMITPDVALNTIAITKKLIADKCTKEIINDGYKIGKDSSQN